MTILLSAISLAGTARTEVAVGTSSELVMFFTTAAATPRSGVVVRPVPSATCAARACFAALAATMSSGVAVVTGRAGRPATGELSVDSLPPARTGAAAGDALFGSLAGTSCGADRGGVALAGAAGGLSWAVPRRVGGGGGGGVEDGRVALVIVDAIWFVVDRGVVDCGVV